MIGVIRAILPIFVPSKTDIVGNSTQASNWRWDSTYSKGCNMIWDSKWKVLPGTSRQKEGPLATLSQHFLVHTTMVCFVGSRKTSCKRLSCPKTTSSNTKDACPTFRTMCLHMGEGEKQMQASPNQAVALLERGAC